MDGGDPDTYAAYYCFVNFGWSPSQYAALSHRERLLVLQFIQKEIASRDKR